MFDETEEFRCYANILRTRPKYVFFWFTRREIYMGRDRVCTTTPFLAQYESYRVVRFQRYHVAFGFPGFLIVLDVIFPSSRSVTVKTNANATILFSINVT